LEPTDARKLFPCLDEPEMKAVFDLTIIHRRDTIALGNAVQAGKTILKSPVLELTLRTE